MTLQWRGHEERRRARGDSSIVQRKCSRCGRFFSIRVGSRFVLCRDCHESQDGMAWLHAGRWYEFLEFEGWPQNSLYAMPEED